MKLKISPFAEKDLQESVAFYNERQENLGIDFFQEISIAFERIKKNPHQFPKSRKNLRRFTVARFPFIIFFIEKDDVCYVLAIFHSSRNPKIIRERHKSVK
jgi:toxin ParE1/3/4